MIPHLAATEKPVENQDIAAQRKLVAAVKEMNDILLGKEQQIQYAVCCVLAGGHLLVEDLPGMGKTTLAQLLAVVLGLGSQRVQFTSDLLPSDILGVSIYDQEARRFKFVAGPVFTQILIADEINRSTPKTQSALLEAMAESSVTIEGTRRDLPRPFTVVATQNPDDQIGTYALPESQMDRFLMRISMGYPHKEAEKKLLSSSGSVTKRIELASSFLSTEEVLLLQNKVRNIQAHDSVIDYIQRLLEFTRKEKMFVAGISPRGGLALLQAAKAWALMYGRDHVMPEDIQRLLPGVWSHRLKVINEDDKAGHMAHIINSVPVIP